QLEDRGVGRVLHEVVVVLREALAVDDEGGLGGDHGLEVGLAVVAHVDDRLVVLVGVGRGHQGARGGGEGHAPVREGLKGAVVGRDDGGGRDLDGLGAVVVLDLDGALGGAVVRRTGGVGLAGGGAARGEGEAEGTGGGEGAEVAPGEGGHGERTFSERLRATPSGRLAGLVTEASLTCAVFAIRQLLYWTSHTENRCASGHRAVAGGR